MYSDELNILAGIFLLPLPFLPLALGKIWLWRRDDTKNFTLVKRSSARASYLIRFFAAVFIETAYFAASVIALGVETRVWGDSDTAFWAFTAVYLATTALAALLLSKLLKRRAFVLREKRNIESFRANVPIFFGILAAPWIALLLAGVFGGVMDDFYDWFFALCGDGDDDWTGVAIIALGWIFFFAASFLSTITFIMIGVIKNRKKLKLRAEQP